MNAVTSFVLGRMAAGGDGVDRSAEIRAQNAANSAAGVAAVLQEQVTNWRIYANRLNVILAAHKVTEAALLEALKDANINHPLATEAGFVEMFDNALKTQYAKADEEHASKGVSSFDQKSVEEMGGSRMDVK